ncbi:MAG TPA: GDP-L-fucose synthase [Spirochaetia bacterium]|nr:GDP-L-fucose synthase [Spirochaetia bacterium]
MNTNARIYVAGHRGLVGSALIRKLHDSGFSNIVTRTSAELDLRTQVQVEAFFAAEKPEYVFLAAAKVGGIGANNTYRAEFIYDNIAISANVIHASYRHGVKKLLNLGSSCIYPRLAPQPLSESSLLSGSLEPTNEPYAIAKISAIKLCRYFNEQYGTNFISAMPTNLYGRDDNFNLETSHVLPALIRRIHEAKVAGHPTVTLWGDGSPLREFLHVDDLADALFFLMQHVDAADMQREGLADCFVNVGSGADLSIKELAELIARTVGYPGTFGWDRSKPNGTPRKLMDVSRMNALGWNPRITLEQGIAATYVWFLENIAT